MFSNTKAPARVPGLGVTVVSSIVRSSVGREYYSIPFPQVARCATQYQIAGNGAAPQRQGHNMIHMPGRTVWSSVPVAVHATVPAATPVTLDDGLPQFDRHIVRGRRENLARALIPCPPQVVSQLSPHARPIVTQRVNSQQISDAHWMPRCGYTPRVACRTWADRLHLPTDSRRAMRADSSPQSIAEIADSVDDSSSP